jgi:hypothetical protein
MATYITQDISTTHDGDLQIDDKGDIKLLDSLETHKKAANFVLRTDYGDYAPNKDVGCNLGTFIGELNTPLNHERMEFAARKGLINEVFSEEDIEISVVPFDTEEALCIVNIHGTYFVSGEFIDPTDQKIVYTFPYIDGQPSPLVI